MASAAALWSGGFNDAPKLLVIATGAAGILLVGIAVPEEIVEAVSSPVVMALLLLSGLGVAALAWTDVDWQDGLLPALLPAGYAGLTILGLSGSRRSPGGGVASAIAALALIAGLTGLIGVVFGVDDWEVTLGGREVPEGLVGYAPPLALLQIAALPVFARWLFSGRIALRAVGLVGLLVAGVTLSLIQNRLCLVLVVLLAMAWIFWPASRPGISGRQVGQLAAAGAVVLVAGVAIGATADSGGGHQADSGIDHGRVELWSDSVTVAAEAPLAGHGPGSFLDVTFAEQESPVRFAHNMVVEEAVELGLPGAVLMLLAIVGSLLEAWRRRDDPTAWLYIPLVVGLAAMAATDWSWHLSGIGALWALALGALLAAERHRN